MSFQKSPFMSHFTRRFGLEHNVLLSLDTVQVLNPVSFKTKRGNRSVRFLVAAALALLCGVCPVFGTGWKVLRGHVPAVVARLKPVGQLAATNELSLAIGLPLRDEAGLDRYLREVYNPASPDYRHFLTPPEFTDRFGPTAEDYARVQEFARTNGFVITQTYPNRLLVNVRANAGDIQRAFHIQLKRYRHPQEARDFYAPDTNPTVSASLRMADVSGLSDYVRPHPLLTRVNPAAAAPRGGSASGGTAFAGNDFRNAYVPGTALDGAGQMVGLVQFDGFDANDIVAYENLIPGAPRVPLQTVLLDGVDGSAGGNNIEVCLDIEMAIAMAPGLSKVVVFEGNLPNSILNAMASSNLVKNLSCSWGWGGGPSATTENIFKTMAAQGQSFFNASGDTNAYLPGQVDDPNNQNYPSGSANITQVGGTTLKMNGAGASYASESVWNAGGGTGSSGGISLSNAIPVWQQGISMSANGGSTVFRNLPDVALTADDVYITYDSGSSGVVVGTSCAAPLWAGFMALVNQRAEAAGSPPVGFVNPALYALAKGPDYNVYFHDTVAGSNAWSASPDAYFATTGYDLCTGWGTPAGTNLINALALPDPLEILPRSGFVSAGPAGGPFTVTSQTVLLTNTSSAPIQWGVSQPADWLTATPAGGLLAVGGAAEVVVTLTAAANTLPAAVYSTGINITNLDAGIVQAVPFSLQVGQTLLVNGGFESGDFSGWTFAGNGIMGSLLYNGVVDANTFADGSGTDYVHSGTEGVALGDTNLAYLSQTIATVPGQDYQISFWLNNLNGSTPNRLLVNWNSPSMTTNTLFDASNLGLITTWSNFQFVVTAAATNTTLQIAALNANDYFGLDDVGVFAIPTPSFNFVQRDNTAFVFGWNSLSGINYQIESATNLAGANWLPLATRQATAASTRFTNTISAEPQRFYRVRRLP
jgi:hypothetical protein